MVEKKRTTRRQFLVAAGGVVGASCLACGGLAAVGLSSPNIQFVDETCGKEAAMGQKVLVVYASKCGSTGEIAQAVGQVLCSAGAAVDVRRVQEVKSLQGYQAVVLGSAARMGKLYDEAVQFARKHQRDLAGLKTAYFYSGATMNTDTPEHRQAAMTCLEPLIQVRKPEGVGLFGGKVDLATLPLLWRGMLSFVKEGDMAPGDHRDWEAIRSWAQGLAASLAG